MPNNRQRGNKLKVPFVITFFNKTLQHDIQIKREKERERKREREKERDTDIPKNAYVVDLFFHIVVISKNG